MSIGIYCRSGFFFYWNPYPDKENLSNFQDNLTQIDNDMKGIKFSLAKKKMLTNP